MRIYQLTDRDFEEFYAIMERIEFSNRMKHGHSAPTSPCKECDLLANYRYYLIGWRNRVMSGDTMHRDAENPTTNWLKNEIERLQRLLPPEAPDAQA